MYFRMSLPANLPRDGWLPHSKATISKKRSLLGSQQVLPHLPKGQAIITSLQVSALKSLVPEVSFMVSLYHAHIFINSALIKFSLNHPVQKHHLFPVRALTNSN